MYESTNLEAENSDQPHTPLAATLHLLLKKIMYSRDCWNDYYSTLRAKWINVRVEIKDNYARSESIDS